MALTFVQNKNGLGTPVSQLVVTFDAAPTAGNLLIARAGVSATGRTFTIAESGWTQALHNSRAVIFYKIAGASEPSTVTLDIAGGTTTVRMIVDEQSGADQTTPLGPTAQDTGTGTSLSSGTTAATTVADALALAVWACGGSHDGGVSLTNSFSTDLTIGSIIAASKYLSATGTVESTASWTTSRTTQSAIAVFNAATTTQLLYPSATEQAGSWTSTEASIHAALALKNDTTYISLAQASMPSTTRVKLGTGQAPAAGTRTWRVRLQRSTGTSNVAFTVTLREGGGSTLGGGTLKGTASSTRTVDGWTTVEVVITGAISDYSNLYAEVQASIA